MSPALIRGLVFSLSLIVSASLMAQQARPKPVKPTGPAAKKAEDLIKNHIARIEKEIAQGHQEVERLRAELHELIDVRDAMADAVADLRGELATQGTYSADPVVTVKTTQKTETPIQGMGPGIVQGMRFRRHFVYGLGSSLPKEPTQEQREQLRRLAPRTDLNRMIKRLLAEVDKARAEVDELAVTLLELSAGIPDSFRGMGGGMGGISEQAGQWFGTMGMTMGGMR